MTLEESRVEIVYYSRMWLASNEWAIKAQISVFLLVHKKISEKIGSSCILSSYEKLLTDR